MTLKNSGGECLRLRYFATKSEIAYNTIANCGAYDFLFNAGGKNGEGIYIGTSNKQWGDGKNPTNDPDETKDNLVHHNYIDTQGNECIDIKEGATANIIEYNTCRGQKDSESGGFDSRGDGNIFRYNDVRGSVGGGIRLGGASVNGIQYGKNNDVYENTIVDNKNGGIRFQTTPQGKICGNTMSGNTTGDSAGGFASEFDPIKSCDNNMPPGNADTTAPSVSFAEISSGSTLSGTVMLSASASDESGISSVQFRIDDETIQTDTTAPYSASLATEGYVDGNHTVAIVAIDTAGNSNSASITIQISNQVRKNANSLANSTTLIASSDNFSAGYEAPKLWDGCYDGVSYDSNTCTAGGRDIPSFWLEFDFGRLYTISQSRLYGDADGEWVSKTWILKYKKDLPDAWTSAFSNKNAFVNGWLTESLNIEARYVRVEVLGDAINFSPGRTQAREFEIYGAEVVVTPSNPITTTIPIMPPPSGGGGGSTVTTPSTSAGGSGGGSTITTPPPNEGGGGGSAIVPPQASHTVLSNPTAPPPPAPKPASQVQTIVLIKPLYQGTFNDETRQLQTFLSRDASIYPEGLITGYFGLLTKKAVQRFQCKYGITCEGSESTTGYGRAGLKTLTKLNELMYTQNLPIPPIQAPTLLQKLFLGSRNNNVKSLQEFLAKDPSIYPEGLITGYFGLLTKKAVQRFQCKYGITCEGSESTTGYGLVGPKTLQKLNQLNL